MAKKRKKLLTFQSSAPLAQIGTPKMSCGARTLSVISNHKLFSVVTRTSTGPNPVDRVVYHPSIVTNEVDLDSIMYTLWDENKQKETEPIDAVLVDKKLLEEAGLPHLSEVVTLELSLSESESKRKRKQPKPKGGKK